MVDHPAEVTAALGAWTPAFRAQLPTLVATLRTARIVWLLGNGGSQACAEHWATDWHKVCPSNGPVFLAPAANAGLLTMLANDEGYPAVYAHMLAGATAADCVIALSTSGASPNLLAPAVDWAICPVATPLAAHARHQISGPAAPPRVLEDLFSILGHTIAEELRP